MIKFNLSQIEAKWREFYLTKGYRYVKPFKNNTSSPLYILPQFPYPSGQLHMGHARVYTISDILNRLNRLKGREVLHPIGWDSFGLPADNAARLHSIEPSEWTKKNINEMTQQLKSLSIDFDFSKTITTSDASYFKWTQTIFCRLYQEGLVYQKEESVNWDPVDCTVLADEQVISGKSWRSGAVVENRTLKQWFIRITAFKDDLLACLDDLPGYPEHIKEMQRNWIKNGSHHDRPFRDWLISRQRDWGTPIPIIHCSSCGPQAVPFKDLPVPLMSRNADDQRSFAEEDIFCPKCSGKARREEDTMDTFMDSSFYYMMFSNPIPSDPLSIPSRPVDIYVGGKEHAILHLLYARFIYKFLYNRKAEPFKRLICQGLVEGKSYKLNGRYLLPKEQEEMKGSKDCIVKWEKMSKSKHNGVNPSNYIDGYGGDALRLALIFKAPPDQNVRWDQQCIVGSQRFLRRLLALAERIALLDVSFYNNDGTIEQRTQTYHSKEIFALVKKLDEAFETDVENMKLNLSIARLMKFTNDLEFSMKRTNPPSPNCLRLALAHMNTLLHPIAPLISSEIFLILNRHLPMRMENVVFEKPSINFHGNPISL